MDQRNLTMICEGFARDENGKIWAMPCKFENLKKPDSVKKKSGGKGPTITRRKYIPLEPLTMNFPDSPEMQPKKRKIERPVCKELFKVPPKKIEKRFSIRNRQSLTKSRFSVPKSTGNRVTKTNLIKPDNDGSPLLNIDEAEEILEGAVFKPKGFKLFSNHSRNTHENSSDKTPVKAPVTVRETTPPLNESYQAELEFLQLEAALASVKKTASKLSKTASPMTSVCTLLENTKISVTEDNFRNGILAIMQEHQEDVMELRKRIDNAHRELITQVDDFQKKYEDRMTRIKELVEGKETRQNVQRRSFRIAAQSVKTKFVVSPAIGKKVDLRKTTLNKNLSRNLQCETPSQKNVSVESVTNEGFYTPKIDKKIANYAGNTATRSISRKLKEQCLLLQNTPKAKQ